MRISGTRAALLLACVLLVVAAGACPVHAYFSSMTSMFTDVPAPSINHAQASNLKNSDFLWGMLSTVPGVNVESNTNEGGFQPIAQQKSLFSFNLNAPPATSSESGWLFTTIAPAAEHGNSPVESGYNSMIKKYGNSSWNVFDN